MVERLYNCSEEDETRAPLQLAIEDADYEHGHRLNELDFLTDRVPLSSDGRDEERLRLQHGPPHSAGRPWIMDNDSRGGHDEHELATELTELATELTMAERRIRFSRNQATVKTKRRATRGRDRGHAHAVRHFYVLAEKGEPDAKGACHPG